jgi:retron-type reverse transcriptase
MISILALLDMSAAFDTVDHDLLLNKLEKLGVIDDALQWIKSYLGERYFSTQVNDVKSKPLPLKMGVPQGSVLGPLLFTVYVKELGDLLREMNMRYNCYADDVQLLVHVPPTRFTEGIKQIEDCILKIKKWTSTNYLQLNEKKQSSSLLVQKGSCRKSKLILSR